MKREEHHTMRPAPRRNPDVTIWIIQSRLSDGSAVYAVQINGKAIDAISRDHADDMAEAFRAAIERNSNEWAIVEFYEAA
jgi:hypothetical protein